MMPDTIMVEWEDSFGPNDEWEDIEFFKPESIICLTFGIKVFENDRIISIAQSYAAPTKKTLTQINGIMTIQKTSIRRIVQLLPET